MATRRRDALEILICERIQREIDRLDKSRGGLEPRAPEYQQALKNCQRIVHDTFEEVR